MPSFLNAAELERVETGGAEIVVRASQELIPKKYIKIFNPQRRRPNFHFHENFSSNYYWDAYEWENQLSLPNSVEKH